jgi:hypothetical protein
MSATTASSSPVPSSTAEADLTALLRAHISHSAPHPATVHPVQACTRFAWTAGGGPLGSTGQPVGLFAPPALVGAHASLASSALSLASLGPPAVPRTSGLKVVVQWPVANAAAEWKKWEAHLAGGGSGLLATAGIEQAGVEAALTVGVPSLPPPSVTNGGGSGFSTPVPGSPAMRGLSGPAAVGAFSSASAAAASAATAVAAQPVLPAPALRTGNRWSVHIDNCYFNRAGGSGAGASAGAGTKLYRVRTSHWGGAQTGAWMLTPTLVLEGGQAMDRFLDSLGGGSGGEGNASSNSLVQVRSTVSLVGEEWLLGPDIVLRLATVKARDKTQSVLVMELEWLAATSGGAAGGAEMCRPLFDLASQLGVPLRIEDMEAAQVQSGSAARIAANLGLAGVATFTPAHAALQYVQLTTAILNATTMQMQHMQQQQ